MKGRNIMRDRTICVTAITLLAVIGSLGWARPAEAQQVDPKVLRKKPPAALLRPVFQVREGLGDMTKWGLKGGIEGDLTKQFRWRTHFPAAKFALYQVSAQKFPSQAAYQPVPDPLIADSWAVAPASGGGFATFTINFKKALLGAFGTAKPASAKLLFVRLVVYDTNLKPISPVSETITLSYAPPAEGTSFGHTMQVRLDRIYCVTETGGGGDDEIRLDIRAASPTKSGTADPLYGPEHDYNTGTSKKFNRVLWEYNGLGFPNDAYIVVAMREVDEGFSGVLGDAEYGLGFDNAGTNIQAVLSNFEDAVCDDDDCIGWPQYLSIGEADWQRVALEKQTIFKTLTFKGLGGHYEVRFRLNPK